MMKFKGIVVALILFAVLQPVTAVEDTSFRIVDEGTSILAELQGEYRIYDEVTGDSKFYPAEVYAAFTIGPIPTDDVSYYNYSYYNAYYTTTNAYWENYAPSIKGRYVIHMPEGDITGQFLTYTRMEYGSYSYQSEYYNYTQSYLYLWTYLTRADTIDFTYSSVWLNYGKSIEDGGTVYLYIDDEPKNTRYLSFYGSFKVATKSEVNEVINGPLSRPENNDMKDAFKMTNKATRNIINIEGYYNERVGDYNWYYAPATLRLEHTVSSIPTNNVWLSEYERWTDGAQCQRIYAYYEIISPTISGTLVIHRETGDEVVKLSWRNLVDSGMDYTKCGNEPWELGHADFYFNKGVQESNSNIDFHWGTMSFRKAVSNTGEKPNFPENGRVGVWMSAANSYFWGEGEYTKKN